MDEDRGIHFDLVVEPAHVLIMHANTSGGYVFSNRIRIVVPVDRIGVTDPAVDLHVYAQPAIPQRIARISALDAFLVVRSVFYLFMDFEQAFRRVGGLFACGDGECFNDLSLLVIRQLVGGFINDDKLCIRSVFTVQFLP